MCGVDGTAAPEPAVLREALDSGGLGGTIAGAVGYQWDIPGKRRSCHNCSVDQPKSDTNHGGTYY